MYFIRLSIQGYKTVYLKQKTQPIRIMLFLELNVSINFYFFEKLIKSNKHLLIK